MLKAAIILLVVLAIAFVLWACANQRRLWWSTHAWRYRSPEASEPSDRALRVARLTKLVLAALLVGGAFLVDGPIRTATLYDQRDVWSVALQAAGRLDQRPQANVQETDVRKRAEEAIAAAGADKVRFRHSGSLAAEGLPFDITNTAGDHPVCLTVYAERLPESSAVRSWIRTTTTLSDGLCRHQSKPGPWQTKPGPA